MAHRRTLKQVSYADVPTRASLVYPLTRPDISLLRSAPAMTMPMAIAGAPMGVTNRNSPYNPLSTMIYNSSNRLYWKSGTITQTAANTDKDQIIQLPVVVNQDGTANAVELVRLDYVLSGWEDESGRRYQMFFLFVDGSGTDHTLASDDCFADIRHVQDEDVPLTDVLIKENQSSQYWFEDHNGHGMLCVAPRITARFTTSGFTAAAGPFLYRLVYRCVQLETSAFVKIRQHQTNL